MADVAPRFTGAAVADADNAAGGPPPLPPPLVTPSPVSTTAIDVTLDSQQKQVKPQMVGRSEFYIAAEDSPRDAQSSPRDAFDEVAVRDAEDEARHTESARFVSIISLIASFVAASLGLGIGFTEETLSLVGFGLESLLDGLSSALVLWRFKKPKQRQHKDEDAAARHKAMRDVQRERNSGIGIGTTFVASSVLLLFLASYKLLAWDPHDSQHVQEEHDGANFAVMLSLPSALVFGVLAMVKFRLARALGSQVLEKDALCSVLGAILALICAIAGIIEEVSNNPDNMAVVDAVASAVIATILLIEGSRTLWHNLGTGWEDEHRQLP